MLARLKALFTGMPSAVSKVNGFTVTVEKKQGVLLTSKPKDAPEGTEGTPASVDEYYEVTVNITGKNPEYPASEKPWTARFTTLLPRMGGSFGFNGGACYVPDGAKFTRFEVREEFNDGRHTIGHRLPPHHSVMVYGYYRTAEGRESRMGVGGGWIRKSEREAPNFRPSRVFYC